MVTLMSNPIASMSPADNLDLEPDEQWKLNLRDEITKSFSSMVDDARKRMRDRLAHAVVSEEERENISKEHHETMDNIRNLAESQFQSALQQERQERRWGAGQQVDTTWSKEMEKEQQAILDGIEKERKQAKPQQPAQPAQPPRTESPETSTTDRKSDGLFWTPKEVKESERESSYFADRMDRQSEDPYGTGRRDRTKSRAGSISGVGMGSYRAPSILETSGGLLDRPKMSPFVDEPEDMTKPSRPPLDMPDRRASLRHKTSISSSISSSMHSRPGIPEIWKPTITPEQDAAMSRTFTLARRGSTASTTSTTSFRPPLPPTVLERNNDPFDIMTRNERERAGVQADQEWDGMSKARGKEKQVYPTIEPRSASIGGSHRVEERYASPTSVSSSPVSIAPSAYPRSVDGPRSFQPPASASRPIITRKTSSIDEGSRMPQPSPGGWPIPSRSPNESRYEGYSRSPRTPDDVPRSWQSSNLRGRLSSQDIRPAYVQQESPIYAGYPVHTHREEPEAESADELDEWLDDDLDEQERMRGKEYLRKQREKELKYLEVTERRKEEDARRSEEDARRKEEDARRREEEERHQEEEERRAQEARRKADEAWRTQEAKRREEEAQEARRNAEEVRRLQEVRRREEEAQRLQEEEERRAREAIEKEREAHRLLEAKRKEEEEQRAREAVEKEKEERRVAEEEWTKHEEIKNKAARRKAEKEKVRREAEARRQREERAQREKEERDQLEKEEREQLEREEREQLEREERERQEAEARQETARQEEEARRRRMAEEISRKEQEAKRKEREARLKEEEATRKEEEAKRKEEEARRKEEEARVKEEEARRKEEAARIKEEEVKRREEEVKRREEELNRREAEAKRWEEEKQFRQQEEFRKREEEIRRQRAGGERKSSDSPRPGSTTQPTPSPSGPGSIPNRNDRATPSTSPPADRSSSGSSRSNASTGWSSASTRPSSTTSTQASTPSKPSTGIPSGTKPTSGTPKPTANAYAPNAGVSPEAEFRRRQAEQAQQREEQFRQEQARLAMQEQERLAKAGKIMSKQEVIKLFELHKAQWDKIQSLSTILWEDFPWPMFKRPKGPDDLTTPAINAYMLSPLHPSDKSTKDRIKDSLRKWHPDRFNHSLPKVKEEDRERVQEGAGSVVRTLNDLLRSSSHDVFS